MNTKKIKVITEDGTEIEQTKRRLITNWLNKCRRRTKPKSEKELSERIDEYMNWCSDNDILPSIELLSASLAVTRQTYYRWCIGQHCSKSWQQICIQARQVVYGSTEQAGLSGEVNAPTAIFLLKNFGYSDQKTLDTLAMLQMNGYEEEAGESPKELYSRYARLYVLRSKDDADPGNETVPDLSAEFMNVPDEPSQLPEWLDR